MAGSDPERPLDGETVFAFDANGNLTGHTDAKGHLTAYAYDDADQLETRTDPLGRAETYTYTLTGRVASVTDRKSQTTSFDYDELDRLTEITYADSSTITYTYDAGNRAVEIDDSVSGVITRSYDGLDRLVSETTPEGTVTYTYDAADRRTSMTVAGQSAVTYSHDNGGRLTAVTQGTISLAFTYDANNRRSTITYPNGVVGTHTYDTAGRTTSVSYALAGSAVGAMSYQYDADGHRTAVAGTWARVSLPATVTAASHDVANQLVSKDAASYSYDLNGNMVTDGVSTYTWNARNQLVAVSGAVSASFAYDALGRRRTKTIGASSTSYLYDGPNIVQELSAGVPTANLLNGALVDETFVRTDADGARVILRDALGSTLALTNMSGAITNTYTYEPFGKASVTGSTGNPIGFTGREMDTADLYFYRARFYRPGDGRFASEDPWATWTGPTPTPT